MENNNDKKMSLAPYIINCIAEIISSVGFGLMVGLATQSLFWGVAGAFFILEIKNVVSAIEKLAVGTRLR